MLDADRSHKLALVNNTFSLNKYIFTRLTIQKLFRAIRMASSITKLLWLIYLAKLVVSYYGTSLKLTILHTNDVHAMLTGVHKNGGICLPEDAAKGDCVGGASRL